MVDKGFQNENDHLQFEGDKDIRKLIKDGKEILYQRNHLFF